LGKANKAMSFTLRIFIPKRKLDIMAGHEKKRLAFKLFFFTFGK
jgi:hypothetical protein